MCQSGNVFTSLMVELHLYILSSVHFSSNILCQFLNVSGVRKPWICYLDMSVHISCVISAVKFG